MDFVHAQPPPGIARGVAVAAKSESPRLWALLVGVDDYVMLQDLQFAGRDVQLLKKRLVSSGFSEERVLLLSSRESDASRQPFRSNIIDQLDYLLGTLNDRGERLEKPGVVRKGDHVVIVLSGHGLLIKDDSFFCPTDARPTDPNTLIPLAAIYQRLQLCEAGMRLMIVDACRNEPVLSGSKSGDHTLQREALARSLEARPEGILMMTSCKPQQVSWEDPGFQHGVFTKFLIDGLSGAADQRGEGRRGNANGRVSLTELFSFASEQTAAHVRRKYHTDQQPVLKVDDLSRDFEFGPYTESTAYETTVVIRQEGADAVPIEAAEVNLFHRSSNSQDEVHLARARSNDRGEARVAVQLTREQEQTGEIIAAVTYGRGSKTTPLASFLDIRRYTIRVPALSPLVDQMRELVAAKQFAAATELAWSNWDQADRSARELFFNAARQAPNWWLDQAVKSCEQSVGADRAIAFAEVARVAFAQNREVYANAVKHSVAASKRVEFLETQVRLQLHLADTQIRLRDRDGALATLKTATTTADLLVADQKIALSPLGMPYDLIPYTGQPNMRRETFFRMLLAARYERLGERTSADALLKAGLSSLGTIGGVYDARAYPLCLYHAENAASNASSLGRLRLGELAYPAVLDSVKLGDGQSLGVLMRHPSAQVTVAGGQRQSFRVYSSLIALQAASQNSPPLFETAAAIAQEVKRDTPTNSLDLQQFRSYLARAYAIQGDLERAEGLIREILLASESVLKNAQSRDRLAVIQRLQNELLHDATAEYAVALARAKRYDESRSQIDSAAAGLCAVAYHAPILSITSDASIRELEELFGWLRKIPNRAKMAVGFVGLAEPKRNQTK